ncbi:MAG: aminodeoxychorismate synthase component I [Opitutaceae bacterium]|jgi:para-aminobenzoate synthetase component 1
MSVVLEELPLAPPPAALFAGLHDRAHAFFLDSGLSAGGLGAYSFIGFSPFLVITAKGRAITITRDGHTETHLGDPLAELQSLLRHYASVPTTPPLRSQVSALSPPNIPFTGGAVGFFGYELCTQLEKIPRTAHDDLPEVPDLAFAFYDGLIAHEHATARTWLVANPVHTTPAPAILARHRVALAPRKVCHLISDKLSLPEKFQPVANFSFETYAAAIARIKTYIASGDVYQVNLTQRFLTPLPCPPFALYERLRARSAAPFASYLNFGPVQIASSSPERFLRIRGRHVETRPIKGTRRRDAAPAADTLLASELLASPKDRAELLMIVDLERNDLGRVCEYGSVRVDDLWHLESHPTVHHLVANVSGTLRPDCDVIDCLRATFPGGSITGAPKIRAMQIIDELEPHRRHVYTGAIGYIGFNGDCDLNIAIRTLTCTGGLAYYSVGGGIVWDSDPAAEYQETLDKGRALHEALTA